MKLSANYYNYGTKALIKVEEFKTIKELFTQIYERDRDQITEIFYFINNELLLHKEPNSIFLQINLDVVQKYAIIENYIIKTYSTEQNKEKIKLLLNLKERLVTYCQTNLPDVNKHIRFESLSQIDMLDFGYESYVGFPEETGLTFSYKISNLDHGKIVVYLIPENKDLLGARFNFRPVKDLISYSLWLTAPEPSKVNTIILKSYSKIPKEITDQWPQL